MTQRPAWRYLQLTTDPGDGAGVRLDGVPTSDGASLGEVVRGLGLDGWEMVGAISGHDARQVLWFRRPIEDAPGPEPPAGRTSASVPADLAAADPSTRFRVTLVGMGRNRSDPYKRRLLVDAVASLTGESGWRATRMVDKAPRVVAERVDADEAERIKRTLEDLGAIVEIG